MTIFVMTTVGALIGLITNFLAILMLFRPWTEWRLGGVRIPFTPGLIPKRQQEIAEKLGEVVERHLVTEEGVVAALQQPEWMLEIRTRLESEFETWLRETPTIGDLIRRFDIPYAEWLQSKLQNKTIEDLLPQATDPLIRQQIARISETILQRVSEWADSAEARQYLASSVQERLSESGMIGRMAVLFVQEDRIISELLPYIKNWLSSPETAHLLESKLQAEWESLLQTPAEKVWDLLTEPSTLTAELMDKLLNSNVYEWVQQHQSSIQQQLDKWLLRLQATAATWVTPLLKSLKIRKIVEQQVASFPIPQLEKLVIDVVRKELSMITWLGAVLGGLIGLIQAIFVVGWK